MHRVLAAAVDSNRYPLPNLSQDRLDTVISKANEKKISAKRASDYSADLYLAQLIKKLGEVRTTGVIIGGLSHLLS